MTEREHLDTYRVAEILRAQFPEIRPDAVSWLGEGYDSTAFEVNGTWVFRFPKRSDVEQQLLLEMRVLPLLAQQSPVPIPAYCFDGAPSELFSRRFGGYAKIPGEPAIRIRTRDASLIRFAPALGRFLSWLHACSPAEAARLGVPELRLASLIQELREDSLGDFEHLNQIAAGSPLEEWRVYLEEEPRAWGVPSPRPVLVHGDFAAEHILRDLTARSITGVIDWSDIAICDASVDLAGLFHWGGRRFVDAVLAHYDHAVDKSVLDRARYLAACRGVADVAFGRETGRPEYIDAGLHAITLCITP